MIKKNFLVSCLVVFTASPLFAFRFSYEHFVISNESATSSFDISQVKGGKTFRVELKDFTFRNLKAFNGLLYLSGDRIVISYFMNPRLKINGTINLARDELNIIITFRDMRVADVVKIFNLKGKVMERLNSRFSGKICLEGRASCPHIMLKAEGQDGNFLDIPFSHARFNLDGVYPFLLFVDSFIEKPSKNRIEIEGILDVRDVDASFKSMKFIQDKMEIGELEVSSQEGKEAVYFRDKEGHYKIFWGASPEERSSVDFLLKLKRNDYLRLRFKDADSVVGLEKRIEF